MEIKVKTKTGETRVFTTPAKETAAEELLATFKKIHEGSIKLEGWEIVEVKE